MNKRPRVPLFVSILVLACMALTLTGCNRAPFDQWRSTGHVQNMTTGEHKYAVVWGADQINVWRKFGTGADMVLYRALAGTMHNKLAFTEEAGGIRDSSITRASFERDVATVFQVTVVEGDLLSRRALKHADYGTVIGVNMRVTPGPFGIVGYVSGWQAEDGLTLYTVLGNNGQELDLLPLKWNGTTVPEQRDSVPYEHLRGKWGFVAERPAITE